MHCFWTNGPFSKAAQHAPSPNCYQQSGRGPVQSKSSATNRTTNQPKDSPSPNIAIPKFAKKKNRNPKSRGSGSRRIAAPACLSSRRRLLAPSPPSWLVRQPSSQICPRRDLPRPPDFSICLKVGCRLP
jgi:hypothetical protein